MTFQWSQSQINLPSNLNGIQWIDVDENNIVMTDNNGTIFFTNKFNINWNINPGILNSLSVSNGKIIGYNSINQVWYSSTISGNWTHITPLGSSFKTISYDELSGIACGVRANDPLNYLDCYVYSNNTWTGKKYPIRSTLYGATFDKNLYVINSVNYDIYYLRNITTQEIWSNYGYVRRPNDNTINLKQIDFNNNILVGVEDINNNVWYTFDVYKEYPIWNKISNANLKQVSVDYNSSIYGSTIDNKLICFNIIDNIGKNDGKYQTAVSSNNKIYISSDYGQTWYTVESSRNWSSVSVSANGQYQTSLVSGGQIFTSSDYGQTWLAKESSKNWISVSVSANGQYQTSLVNSGQIFISSDYGQTWSAKESSRNWSSVSVSASGQYQTAVVNGGQIFISSDYGQTWSAKESSRNWLSVSVSTNGQYQTAVVTGLLGGLWGSRNIYVSLNYGQTWSAKNYDRNWYGVSVSASGQYQTAVSNGGQIFISSDYGQTWSAKESSRSWKSVSVSASGQYQTAVIGGVFGTAGQIYISSDYGQNWSAKESSIFWNSISISMDLPYCRNNYNVSYIMKDVDDWSINPGNELMNARKNTSLVWNPTGSLNSSNYPSLNQYKILISFSQPVNIKNIYVRFTNNIDISHSATEITLYPNIYIGNSTNSKVQSIKINPEPSPILNITNLTTNLNTDFNYYVKNPIINTDTGLYSNYTIVFKKETQFQIYLSYLDFDTFPYLTKPPNKVIVSTVSPSINSVNIGYKIPDNNITKYTIKSYYTDNNITKCGPKTIIDMTNQNNPYYNLLNKPVGSSVNFGINNINDRLSFVGTPSNLPSCEPYDNYSFISYTPITKEPYIFTLKAVNDVGESDMSEPTTQDIVPLVETPLPTIPPSPTGTIEIPPSTGPVKIEPQIPVKKDNNIIFIVLIILTIFIIIGGGIWFFYNKNNVSPEQLKN
jgi:hypothetical protein